MSILKDMFAELFGMFVSDVRLTLAILGVVAMSAVMLNIAEVRPMIVGAALLLGNLGVLVAGVTVAARRERRP